MVSTEQDAFGCFTHGRVTLLLPGEEFVDGGFGLWHNYLHSVLVKQIQDYRTDE